MWWTKRVARGKLVSQEAGGLVVCMTVCVLKRVFAREHEGRIVGIRLGAHVPVS